MIWYVIFYDNGSSKIESCKTGTRFQFDILAEEDVSSVYFATSEADAKTASKNLAGESIPEDTPHWSPR